MAVTVPILLAGIDGFTAVCAVTAERQLVQPVTVHADIPIIPDLQKIPCTGSVLCKSSFPHVFA